MHKHFQGLCTLALDSEHASQRSFTSTLQICAKQAKSQFKASHIFLQIGGPLPHTHLWGRKAPENWWSCTGMDFFTKSMTRKYSKKSRYDIQNVPSILEKHQRTSFSTIKLGGQCTMPH